MYSKVLIVCSNEEVKKKFIPAFEDAGKRSVINEYVTVEDFKKRSKPLQPTIDSSISLFTQKKIEGIKLDVYHTIQSFDLSNLFNGKEDGIQSEFLPEIDLFILVLDETALVDLEALKTYLTVANQQSPKAKFQIVFYKNHEYEDSICTQINQIFSSLNFEKQKWDPQEFKGYLKSFVHFGYEGAALDVFNALQEPFYLLLKAGLEAVEKEKISYKISQSLGELWQKISEKIASWWHNLTISGTEKTNELVKKAPIAVEEETNVQNDMPSEDSIITEENKIDDNSDLLLSAKPEVLSINEKKQDKERENNFITSIFHTEKKSDTKPQKEKLTAEQVLTKIALVGQDNSLTLTRKQEQAIALVRDNIDRFNQDDIYRFIPLTISKEFEKGEPAYKFITSPNADPYFDPWFASRACIFIPNEIYFNKVKEKNGSLICRYKVIKRTGGTGIHEVISIDQNTTDEELKLKIIEDARAKRCLFSAQDCMSYLFIRKREKGVFYNIFGHYTDTNAWNTINELLWQRLQTLDNDKFKPPMFSNG